MKRIAIVLAAVTLIFPTSSEAQQSPTPMRPAPKPAYVPGEQPAPVVRTPTRGTGGWQRFQGATVCTQVDRTLSCDNGYRQTVR